MRLYTFRSHVALSSSYTAFCWFWQETAPRSYSMELQLTARWRYRVSEATQQCTYWTPTTFTVSHSIANHAMTHSSMYLHTIFQMSWIQRNIFSFKGHISKVKSLFYQCYQGQRAALAFEWKQKNLTEELKKILFSESVCWNTCFSKSAYCDVAL